LNVIRKFVVYITLIFILVLAAAFTYNNPVIVSIDLGVAKFEAVPLSIAVIVSFAIGWFFGLLAAGIALIRISAERRKLRRKLQLVELELNSIKSRPLQDAN
jgi:uncharacterized membrane protein YciS (DUF1049 family)